MDREHILLLGATGASGLAFIDFVIQLPRRPRVTLYLRPSSRAKLPVSVAQHQGCFRIVEGELNSSEALGRALRASADSESMPVTTVVSFLGAYVSLKALITRDASHPIADALQGTLLPTMKSCGVSRILVLSTPTAFSERSERNSMSWKWWFYSWIPLLFAPQGNAEMAGIASAVMGAGSKDRALEWTVFRVPHLTDGDVSAKVVAGYLDESFSATTDLSRGSLVRWVIEEVEKRQWIGRAPMLANA